MEKFLSKKWLAPVSLFIYVLVISFVFVRIITPTLKEVLPHIVQESAAFLPISFQNGEIVTPENTIISKTYSLEDNKTFNIVLDTRTDTLDLNTLSDGLYLSKKCVYMVSPDEKRSKCFSSQAQESFVITKEIVEAWANSINERMDSFLYICFVVALFVGFYLIILLYTLISYLIVTLLSKTTFGQTLFINTFTYMLCNMAEVFASINTNFLIKLLLFICVNLLICKTVKKNEAA